MVTFDHVSFAFDAHVAPGAQRDHRVEIELDDFREFFRQPLDAKEDVAQCTEIRGPDPRRRAAHEQRKSIACLVCRGRRALLTSSQQPQVSGHD
jgi:hypothetical protein